MGLVTSPIVQESIAQTGQRICAPFLFRVVTHNIYE